MVRCSKEQLRRLTFRFRSGGAGNRNVQGVDGEGSGDEEDESSFEEHDDMGCREEEQVTTAPGLKFGR